MTVRFLIGDALERLRDVPDGLIQMAMTSPPYFGLRDYDDPAQIGHEQSLEGYIGNLVAVFREVRRTLTPDGVFMLNIGDTYARNPAKGGSGPGGKNRAYSGESYTKAARPAIPPGIQEKELIGIPWTLAFAMRADGWLLRQEIIWHKPNAMPETAKDRCVRDHEHLFLFTKAKRYHFDAAQIAEPATVGGMRGKRTVWSINTAPFKGAHFAPYPPALVEPCILAGSREGDTILDPFCGTGTTGLVAARLKRRAIMIELNPEYAEIARQRIARG